MNKKKAQQRLLSLQLEIPIAMDVVITAQERLRALLVEARKLTAFLTSEKVEE